MARKTKVTFDIPERLYNELRMQAWKFYFTMKLARRVVIRLENRCNELENSALGVYLGNELMREENENLRDKIRACHDRMDHQ